MSVCLSGHNNESLHKHLIRVKEEASKLVKEYDLTEEEKKLLELLAVFHDIGKCEKYWQKNIKEKRRTNRPHALFSALLFYKLFYDILKEGILYTLTFVILTHHRPFHLGLYKSWQDNIETLEFYFDNYLYNLLKKYNNNIKQNEKVNVSIYKQYILPYIHKVNIELYTKLLGILKEADYKAVSPPSKKDSYPYQEFNFNLKLNPLQREVNKLDKYKILLIVAPTGIGKTEASLIYAQKFNKRRIFYTIPISFAINVMRDRLSKYFPEHSVDIYHHWSHIFRILAGEEEIFESSIFSKRFFNAVNIIAPDHIVLTLLKSGDWTPRLMSMYNSTIIFDECHLYDPYFFWFTITSLEHLFKITSNVNAIFMTATAPRFLYDILKQKFGDINIIFNKNWYDTQRDRFHSSELKEGIFPEFGGFIKDKDIIDIAANKAREGKKVLIVRNSVKRAQELYEEFKKRGEQKIKKLKIKIDAENETSTDIIYRIIENVPVLLAHRRYTFGDRFAREKLIQEWDKNKKGWILIATQIVEVSLDIDFDVLITDLAPIPALVQRLGRINRKRNKKDTEVYIIELGGKQYWKPYLKEEIEVSKELLDRYLNKNIIKDSEWFDLVEKHYEQLKEKFIRISSKGIEPSKEIKEWIDQWKDNLYPNGPLYLSSSDLKPLEIIHDRTLLEELLFANVYKEEIEGLKEKISYAKKEGNEKEAFKKFALLGIYTIPVPVFILQEEEFKYGIVDGIYVPYDRELGLIEYEEDLISD